MKNRLYLVCGVLLVAALGGLLWWSPREPPEPVYEGMPLNHWLTMFPNPPPPTLMSDSNAIPFVIRDLKVDCWFGAAIYRKQVWPRLPSALQRHLRPPVGNPALRQGAAGVLWLMGPTAKAAAPALIVMLKEDDSCRSSAASALCSILEGSGDDAVVAALARASKDKDPDVRRCAITPLASIGKWDALTEALKDKDVHVRMSAVQALAKGKGGSDVVAALTEALNDKDWGVQLHAAWALARIGEGRTDSNVVAILIGALSHKFVGARTMATNGLLKLDPEAAAKAGVKAPPP
jgi:HEAT repeat protein